VWSSSTTLGSLLVPSILHPLIQNQVILLSGLLRLFTCWERPNSSTTGALNVADGCTTTSTQTVYASLIGQHILSILLGGWDDAGNLRGLLAADVILVLVASDLILRFQAGCILVTKYLKVILWVDFGIWSLCFLLLNLLWSWRLLRKFLNDMNIIRNHFFLIHIACPILIYTAIDTNYSARLLQILILS